jgi:hypothetical protein
MVAQSKAVVSRASFLLPPEVCTYSLITKRWLAGVLPALPGAVVFVTGVSASGDTGLIIIMVAVVVVLGVRAWLCRDACGVEKSSGPWPKPCPLAGDEGRLTGAAKACALVVLHGVPGVELRKELAASGPRGVSRGTEMVVLSAEGSTVGKGGWYVHLRKRPRCLPASTCCLE